MGHSMMEKTMPKSNINSVDDPACRIEVGWSAGTVQIGSTNAGAPFTDGPVKGTFEFVASNSNAAAMTGWFANLDREGCNRLIREVRRARDAAFGADA